MQILVTKNPMTWDTADEICPLEFKGSGYRHLAADIMEGPYNLLTVKNYDSVWLDSKAYYLGCRGKRFKVPSSGMFNILNTLSCVFITFLCVSRGFLYLCLNNHSIHICIPSNMYVQIWIPSVFKLLYLLETLLFSYQLLHYFSGDRCSFIVIRHRRLISHDFKHLCLTGK